LSRRADARLVLEVVVCSAFLKAPTSFLKFHKQSTNSQDRLITLLQFVNLVNQSQTAAGSISAAQPKAFNSADTKTISSEVKASKDSGRAIIGYLDIPITPVNSPKMMFRVVRISVVVPGMITDSKIRITRKGKFLLLLNECRGYGEGRSYLLEVIAKLRIGSVELKFHILTISLLTTMRCQNSQLRALMHFQTWYNGKTGRF
jgi:hypothetical protein